MVIRERASWIQSVEERHNVIRQPDRELSAHDSMIPNWDSFPPNLHPKIHPGLMDDDLSFLREPDRGT